MAITEKMRNMIDESGSMSGRLSCRLKGSGLDIIIRVSPLSCRSPEETILWHPIHERRPLFVKIFVYFYIIITSSLLGIARFFSYRGFWYNSVKKHSPAILIIPDEITDHSSEIKTDYLIENDNYPIDRIVFSRAKNIGYRFCKILHTERIKIFFKISSEVAHDFKVQFRRGKINLSYIDSLVIFLKWFLSQSWYFHWDFYRFINWRIDKSEPKYKILVSVHEMHFYSRVIWRVGHERGLQSLTAQHAMIIPEKLWYFPFRSELEDYTTFPDIFFVYSDETQQALAPFYPKTRFLLCCSPRFKKWKLIHDDRNKNVIKGGFILFVSGIMPYDVRILIRSIKKLIGEVCHGKAGKIRLRLHPHAGIYRKDISWIKTALDKRYIQISNGPLDNDLSGALLVIGANSTVLQESMLLGIPSLSISDRDYIHPSILPQTEEWNVPLDSLSWKRIKDQVLKKPDYDLRDRFKKNMGLYNTDFSTSLIYGACDARENSVVYSHEK